MPVTTCHTNWQTREFWNDYAFMAEERVRDSGGEDPADLHIAYEYAKAQVDEDAARQPQFTPGEPTYRVYVRVVRQHTTPVVGGKS